MRPWKTAKQLWMIVAPSHSDVNSFLVFSVAWGGATALLQAIELLLALVERCGQHEGGAAE
jgi:hypothetical protein